MRPFEKFAFLMLFLGEPIWAGYEGESMVLYLLGAFALMVPMMILAQRERHFVKQRKEDKPVMRRKESMIVVQARRKICRVMQDLIADLRHQAEEQEDLFARQDMLREAERLEGLLFGDESNQ